MAIKHDIGLRITKARKACQLTTTTVAKKIGMSLARLSNWERGVRTPGVTEVKLLAQALRVSPSYLLCLTDDPQGKIISNSSPTCHYLPLIALSEIHLTKKELRKKIRQVQASPEKLPHIVINNNSGKIISDDIFATELDDNSMQPEFLLHDTIIVNSNQPPEPGQYVLAHIASSQKNILRKYREIGGGSASIIHYELIAMNADWGTIEVKSAKQAKDVRLLGTVIEHRRQL